jgi:predicted metalloprotease with PDZ domain
VAGIAYRLSMPDRHTHLFHVELLIRQVEDPVSLVMPSWTPGSYLLREFPRHVQNFSAESGNGTALPWRKTDKNTWRVESEGGDLRIRYEVYANELTVRTSHLDASHGYVNGTSVFMYVDGREREPLTLQIDVPGDWRITTALPAGERPGCFLATGYDELADSPIEMGTHETIEWEIDGRSHRYALWGRGNYDAEQLVADTSKIVLATKALFGSLPYEQYTFIVHLVSSGYGGLEHRNSTSLLVDRWTFRGKEYEQFLGLVAHEFFHVWNGKRIRPEPLGPFDYTRENYTRNLWVIEGLTTYYTDLVLRRAGTISVERYLERLSEAINRLQSLPGRRVQSLEESSFDTWIKFYRPDEHTPNAQISYYQKGALVGLLLDLKIREATANQRSLDDVMRVLWERYGEQDIAFPEFGDGGIEAVAEEVCGEDLTPFFDAYLRGTEELDYERYLSAAGLTLDLAAPDDGSDTATTSGARDGRAIVAAKPAAPPVAEPVANPPGTEARLGIRMKQDAGRLVVTHVLADTPAYAAGLNSGDEILALDGLRVNLKSLPARLDEADPGDVLEFAIFRHDELMTLQVPFPANSPPRLQVSRVAEPTALQSAIFRDWLGADEGGPAVAASVDEAAPSV